VSLWFNQLHEKPPTKRLKIKLCFFAALRENILSSWQPLAIYLDLGYAFPTGNRQAADV
jgi:hypothetical protein